MNNSQAVKAYRDLKKNERRRTALWKKQQRLDRELGALDVKIQLGRRVTRIEPSRGIAIEERRSETYGHDYNVRSIAGVGRWAEVYTNANNKTVCGVKVYDRDSWDRNETFCGSGWKSRKRAEAAALEYVISGKKPLYDGVE